MTRLIREAVLGCLVVVSLLGARAHAHEGHAALPTKGSQVDLKQGTVFLSREARDALGVETAEVQLLAYEQSALAYATLESPWTRHAFATSRVGGRVERMFVKPGEYVRAGDPLAEVRSLEHENLQLELLNAQTAWSLSRKLTSQRERLAREGALAGRDALEAEANHRENANAVKVARLKLSSLGWSEAELERLVAQGGSAESRPLVIASPISGVVVHTDLTVGRVIEPNEHLFEIVDLTTLWVRLSVLEKDLFDIAAGQAVALTLSSYPGKTFPCRVQVTSQALEPTSRLGTAWGELTNPPGREPIFLPGMTGQARVVVSSPGKRASVPSLAIVGEGAERFVLVEEEATAKGSLFRRRNVVVESARGRQAFLRDGKVYPGDRVLTQGAHILASYFAAGVLRPSNEAKTQIGLRVEPVRARPIGATIDVDGVVDVPPDRRAKLSAQFAGTLERIHVDRAQQVKAGDVVAEIGSLEFQNLQLELLQADRQARRLADQRRLVGGPTEEGNPIVARYRLWELDSDHSLALQRREAALRKLRSSGLEDRQLEAILQDQQLVKALPLRSPIDGAVVHFEKSLGQAVKPDEVLFEIHDLSRVWVKAFLSERQLGQVRLDAKAPHRARIRLAAAPHEAAGGKVVRSGRLLETESRALSLWIELDAATSRPWPHDMLATATLSSGPAATVLAVPHQAIARDGLRAFVFVERPDGVLERRAVETGRQDDRFIEVVRGLRESESIAVSGASDLQTAYSALR